MVSNYCLICISTFLNQRKHRSILPAFVFTRRSLQTGIYYSTQLGYLRLDSRLSFIPLPFRLSNIQMIFYLSLTRQLLRFCKYCDLEFESWKGKGGSPLRKRCTVNDILKMSPLTWVIGETQWPKSALDTGSRGATSRHGLVNVLCSLERHLNLTVPLSTQGYKWVLNNCQGSH